MATVLVAGGTGMIGRHWIATQGYLFDEVRLLSRSPGRQGTVIKYAWDPAAGTYDPEAFRSVDYIINLAGAGIADERWTEDRKRLIVSSREDSARTLLKALQETGAKPAMILSASATGYYGDRGAEWVDENAEPGHGFLSTTTQAWEAASMTFKAAGHPLAVLRIGIVLSNEGGALPKLKMPLKVGMANYFGDGQQYMPWIHIDDITSLMTWILQGKNDGVWNGVAPEPVTSKQMATALKKAFGGWLVAPVPAAVLRLLLGEMSDTVLTGARVSAEKVVKAGFGFRYSDLDQALLDLKSK
ncbi:MAG: TIGR01777 family oxidoreductase [Saprospiraceae bacterium]|nr:TIGR01777 family oxidoreductase [Saprospiraceae bacterium]